MFKTKRKKNKSITKNLRNINQKWLAFVKIIVHSLKIIKTNIHSTRI